MEYEQREEDMRVYPWQYAASHDLTLINCTILIAKAIVTAAVLLTNAKFERDY